MDLFTENIIIFEENKTRADLYRLWLDEYDAEIALTRADADEKLDGEVAVAVLERSFADGNAKTLLDIIQTRSPICRVVSTRDRSSSEPELDVEHRLTKPVFSDDLTEVVRRLLYQANYHLLLRLYYKTTINLSECEMGDSETDVVECESLRDRVARLQELIRELRGAMASEDIVAVRRSIVFNNEQPVEEAEASQSKKYRPDSCGHCGQSWDESTTANAEPARQLAAYVWRCTSCGHTEMRTDANHQNVSWRGR